MKENRNALVWITIAVVVILIAVAIFLVKRGAVNPNASQAPVQGTAQVGKPAPEFQALTTAGLFDLRTATKPVFLEVFATWCPHCQRETAVLDRLYSAYKNSVEFVAVSGSDTAMDGRSPSSQNDVLAFQSRFNVRYPIAYDGSLTVAKLYLQGGFPTFAIIDASKTVVYLNAGEVSYGELDTALRRFSGP